MNRETGVVTALSPAGGVITTKDSSGEITGLYYISNFDPLAGKLKKGTEVTFKPTNPGEGRNVAVDVKRNKT